MNCEECAVILEIDDWIFQIDFEKTAAHSSFVSNEHCACAYCRNYYQTIGDACPDLKQFLDQFGVLLDAPSEMYPIEPTLYLSGYRVTGDIIQWGTGPMMVSGVPVTAQPSSDGTFLLEVGELVLPWVLEEDMDEVISPANEPEFLQRMYRKLALRSGYSEGLMS